MRGVFQATIVDENGSIIPSCNIEVLDEVSGASPQLYDAITAGSTLGNPFAADVNGFARLYVESGTYRVRAYLGAFERIWRHVIIGETTAGTIVGTLTGFASALAATLSYKRSGHLVTLSIAADTTGTSTTTAMTFVGIPEELQPSNDQFVSCVLYNNSGNVAGYAFIDADSDTIVFSLASPTVVTNKVYPSDVFTGSGAKGLRTGIFSLTYSL